MRTSLVDSSVLIAVANRRDANHDAAVAALRGADEPATPITILAETMSFIRARLGVEKQRSFWSAFSLSGIEVLGVDVDLIELAREIDGRYADASFGFADAVLLASCERHRCDRVLSFDRRLGLYRLSSGRHLSVAP